MCSMDDDTMCNGGTFSGSNVWSIAAYHRDTSATPTMPLETCHLFGAVTQLKHVLGECRIGHAHKPGGPYNASPIPQTFQPHQSTHSSAPSSPKQFTFSRCDNKHSGSWATGLDRGPASVSLTPATTSVTSGTT